MTDRKPWTVKQDDEGAWQISDPEGKPQGRYLNAHELATYLAMALCGVRDIEAENKRLLEATKRFPEIVTAATRLRKQVSAAPLFIRQGIEAIRDLASVGIAALSGHGPAATGDPTGKTREAADAESTNAAPTRAHLPSAASAVKQGDSR